MKRENKSNIIKIGIADGAISKSPNILKTLGLGSCVGVCIYSNLHRVGALIHVMLPVATKETKTKKEKCKYADTGINYAIKEIKKMTNEGVKLTAKIAGGANMFKNINVKHSETIGAKNVDAVKKMLSKNNIPIEFEETGGNEGRTIHFELDSGNLCIYKNNRKQSCH